MTFFVILTSSANHSEWDFNRFLKCSQALSVIDFLLSVTTTHIHINFAEQIRCSGVVDWVASVNQDGDHASCMHRLSTEKDHR